MKKQKDIHEVFPSLAQAVYATHKEFMARLHCKSFYCHDFDHAFRVGKRALEIAGDRHIGELAGAAGLCHNADRLLQKQDGSGPFGDVEDQRIINMVNGWLDTEPQGTFNTDERDLILDAVLHHAQPNGLSDSPILITLMDADRTVNLELDVVVRGGQYTGDALPVIDPHFFIYDPNASFKNPGCTLRGDYEKFDWGVEGGFVGIRLPKARELAKPRLELLKKFLNDVTIQRMDSGLYPYPKFE